MPVNDREVFEKLTGGGDAPSVDNFITYALFAFERREWINHHAGTKGEPPSDADIETWISNISDYQFEQMRARAASFFDVASREYMADEMEAARQEVLKSAVVKEVKAAGNFWRQLFIATATAIIGPVIIGLIIVAALKSEAVLPTITGSQKYIQDQKQNGQ